MIKKLICKIDVKGNITVDVEGVTGEGCQKLTEELLQSIIGNKSETLKPEFYSSTQKDKDYVFN